MNALSSSVDEMQLPRHLLMRLVSSEKSVGLSVTQRPILTKGIIGKIVVKEEVTPASFGESE